MVHNLIQALTEPPATGAAAAEPPRARARRLMKEVFMVASARKINRMTGARGQGCVCESITECSYGTTTMKVGSSFYVVASHFAPESIAPKRPRVFLSVAHPSTRLSCSTFE